MKQEVLKNFDQPELVVFAFLIFFAFFLGMLAWVFLIKTKDQISTESSMALQDDEIAKE